uniref:NADH dehydrogenase subunit 6 n=1 Tax=Knipowitschia caucasica TaxID=637954 RepID=A0AAV2KN84_KNICA
MVWVGGGWGVLCGLVGVWVFLYIRMRRMLGGRWGGKLLIVLVVWGVVGFLWLFCWWLVCIGGFVGGDGWVFCWGGWDFFFWYLSLGFVVGYVLVVVVVGLVCLGG